MRIQVGNPELIEAEPVGFNNDKLTGVLLPEAVTSPVITDVDCDSACTSDDDARSTVTPKVVPSPLVILTLARSPLGSNFSRGLPPGEPESVSRPSVIAMLENGSLLIEAVTGGMK